MRQRGSKKEIAELLEAVAVPLQLWSRRYAGTLSIWERELRSDTIHSSSDMNLACSIRVALSMPELPARS